MQDLKQVDDQLNEMTSAGQIIDALGRFYAVDCTFQEGNKATLVGRKAHHDHLTDFFSTLKEFKGAKLHSQGVGDDVTLTEWTFEMEGPDGPIVWNEILRRQWRDEKVVSERYYTAD